MPPRQGSNGALVLAHVAGMIDLVALPVWVNTLIDGFHFDAQRAGALATTYLAFAVLCSVCVAPLFARLPGRLAAALGFLVAACGFGLATQVTTFGAMFAAHAVAGAGIGCGLSVVHGAIGKTANPHRLFAMGHLALAVFGVAYFAAVPPLVSTHGGALLFVVFVGLSLVASLALAAAWPAGLQGIDAKDAARRFTKARGARLERGCWSAIAGIVFMAINQAMVFSFAQRIGLARGFGAAQVNAVLIAVGLVNLLPPVLAALLQRRFDARNVALAGPLAQAALALVIGNSTSFAPYALAASLWVFAMIFTHTFLFGLLAKLDATGRAVAYTPAMLMAGSAMGPLLGGMLIVRFGFGALGIASVCIALVSFLCFGRLRALALVQPQLDLPSAH
ncbi:putative MFS family arabinose efflux permease [Paraburkholderia bannensis]|uniref:Putative MFS family arabinose efflux permease n=1 Tax=Paraburkholderia bannensis TaxID=765414 RepID=A0A7W9WRW8_9BURK|nr:MULTISPECIES: MFS transporter [Paraburkholderia]MBB3258622.1 putative MFS family arabinose efflux permease [Paraburkholderia sp. WP4_3_2]MBB6103635.1 putative MFS family arabinose efflux permease [Paraburkholderia bannensis]